MRTTSSRDNWERLVAAVIKRDQIWQLCHQDSITTIHSSDYSQRDLSFSNNSLRSVSISPSPQLPLANNSLVEAPVSHRTSNISLGGNTVSNSRASEMILTTNFTTLKRPAASHIVTKLEVALHQQEKAESLPLKERTSVEDDTSPSAQILSIPILRIFTLSELKGATRNFRNDSMLGEGDLGKVYKGSLREKASGKSGSGTLIAVRRLNSESMQGFQEWLQSEVNFLGRLSHPNLVRLLGYCWGDKELLLVNEYMPKGSLKNHLFGTGAYVQPLPWDIRLKILTGAARGLEFLHASDKKVIYTDFKASNILLDGSYHAKLSDFGLPMMGPTAGASHVSTQVMGTSGYAAPEYVATGHLYVKSDVYGFGVVLVEMMTGLRAFDTNRPSGQQNLTDWIKPHLSEWRRLKHIIDFRLEGRYPIKSAFLIALLALTCLEAEPKNRPSMEEIVEMLERIGSFSEA